MLNSENIKQYIDETLVKCYQLMIKNNRTLDQFIDLFYNSLENTDKEVIKYVKENFKELEFKPVTLKDMLYDDKDEERIKQYYDEYDQKLKSKEHFLSMLARIIDTENMLLQNNLMIAYANQIKNIYQSEGRQVYITLYIDDDSDCGEHSGGEYYLEEVEALCSHPNCDCNIINIKVRIDDKNIKELDIEDLK